MSKPGFYLHEIDKMSKAGFHTMYLNYSFRTAVVSTALFQGSFRSFF